MSTVGENSKSLRSPSTTTLADASASRMVDEVVDRCACLCRCTSERDRRLERPNSGSSPPLESKWLAMTKTVCAAEGELAGERLAAAVPRRLVGSMRPGRGGQVRRALPSVTPVGGRRVPPGRSTKATRGPGGRGTPGGCCRPARRRPGRRPGRSSAQSYAGPPRRAIAPISLFSVWSAATVPSSVAPLSSWISSRATMSGRLQVGDDLAGEPVELRLRVVRGQVLDVVRRDRELVVALARR